MFRSKYRQRRFSNDLNIYKQINFHSDKINFHAGEYSIALVTLDGHSGFMWVVYCSPSILEWCGSLLISVSYTLLIIITSLSSRYGKWILFAYSLIFMMSATISYCTNIRNSFYGEVSRIRGEYVDLMTLSACLRSKSLRNSVHASYLPATTHISV